METKERILQAAEELFYKYGIKSVTMDDIAKHLAISKKTIYQFFEDKNGIVVTHIGYALSNNEKALDEINKKSDDAIHEIFLSMTYMAGMFQKMNPSLFYDLQKYHPKAWDLFTVFREKKILGHVERNIKKGIEEGLYRADINVKIMARLRIEEVGMAMNPAIFSPDKFSISDVQIALLEHFLYGIVTIKGHKLINKYKEVTEEE